MKGDKKQNRKREKGNKTLNKKAKKGRIFFDKNAIKEKEAKIKVMKYELLAFTLSYLMLAP
jgi:hypothetical protein